VQQLRNSILIVLGAGSVLAMYVLSGSFNSATSIEPGLVLAVAGYVVLWMGAVREYVVSGEQGLPALGIV
jgi:hypothetical protein